MPSLRHRVRTIALQALFELDATDHAPDEIVTRWLDTSKLKDLVNLILSALEKK